MAGLNKSGVPSTDSYRLGRGKLYLSLLDSSDRPIAFRDVGNATEFTINLETETLEHQSSREGLRKVDKEVILTQKTNVSFSLDNLEYDNLALFFSAAVLEYPTTSGTLTDIVILSGQNAATSLKGKWLDLYDSANGERIYGIDTTGSPSSSLWNVEVDDNAGFSSPTLLVQGTDYLVDDKLGRIFFISTGPNITGLSGNVWVRYSIAAARNPGQDMDELQLFTQTNPPNALKFISENPAASDAHDELQLNKITLKPDGDLAQIGDDWSSISLTGVAEEAPLADADAPVGRLRTYDGM